MAMAMAAVAAAAAQRAHRVLSRDARAVLGQRQLHEGVLRHDAIRVVPPRWNFAKRDAQRWMCLALRKEGDVKEFHRAG